MTPQAKTDADDFLALLCWSLEKLLNPSPARILESFESWNYRNCLRPQLRALERARLIERQGERGAQTYRVTAAGRLAVAGGIDPVTRWSRPWDGQWRLVMFDLPTKSHTTRTKLWRWFQRHRFGYLQNSVWITPDPLDATTIPVNRKGAGADVLLVLEAKPGPGFANPEIVQGAWDFQAINAAYQEHLGILAEADGFSTNDAGSARLRQWLKRERLAWLEAVSFDPLLPSALHPAGYAGETAWAGRRQVLSRLAANPLSPAGVAK